MKKQLFSLAILLGLATSFAETTVAAQAPVSGREQRQDGRGKDHKQGKHGPQDQQRRTDQMAKELDLSSKQKSKVEKIFQEQQQQMQALRSRSGQDRSQHMAEAKRIHEAADKKLKDVLSKKQYAQLAAKRQERQRQMGSRQGDRRGGFERREAGGRS
ncbi:hypothetical protein [Hymenobacter sp. AT01-02]|uniref:hypothetical protein n=1 Tax=Hymenobacter sp. AT01-02 TaxID=1571877 RepID=UPI0005F10D74|nr:hypothetical protein [Hymenobacter sp. AT01-02]